jgi:glycogen debranching enzyme
MIGMSVHTLLQDARTHARRILDRCVTPHGLRASGLPAGYPQIWARDSMIVFLGAAAIGDEKMIGAARASLEIMSRYQSCRGLIQLNVNPDNGYVSTENAGAVDANLWYIIGHYLHCISRPAIWPFCSSTGATSIEALDLARLSGHERVRPAGSA